VDNPLDHTGKVVLVTGGTKGIGRTIAERYLGAGATVVVCGRKAPAGGSGGSGGSAPDFVACDVREPDQVGALVDEVVARHGSLDVAVNNAGGSPYADSATVSPRFSESIVKLNLLAPLYVAQAAYRVMPDGGAIVNVASVSGIRPTPGTAAYGAAKAGLLNLTQTLAVEWAPKVRVAAVVAGIIETENAVENYGDQATIDRMAATVPLGRLGTPGDIADTCLYLSSPLASYVSGTAVIVHGGGESPAYLSAFQT
jgi:NAD(P)-dependent dehydrogenase (short-subunit alcohol dehydrogenase family)